MEQNNKPEGEDIFIKDTMDYLCQLKMRPQVLKVLKEHFEVREMLVLSPKQKETN